MTASLVLFAVALLVMPASCSARFRLVQLYPRRAQHVPELDRSVLLSTASGAAVGMVIAVSSPSWAGYLLAVPLGLVAGWAARYLLVRQDGTASAPDPLSLAAGWDLLAACLRCGLPVARAVAASADHVPGVAARELRTIADRLALGADPAQAWRVPESSALHKLARAARRSAHSGASLARVAEEAAAELRGGAVDSAMAKGQRAGVLITGPLGLCFLPAFLVLGVAPVVMGLASGMADQW